MSIFKKTKKADMLEGPYLKKMVFFALPVLLTNVLQLLYNHADQIVVGHYNGTEAFASINSTNSLVHLILNLFMGIAVGVNVVVAHSLGAKNVEKARKIVHTSLIAAAVIGVVVGGAGVALSKTFLKWMNSPDDIIGLSSAYLRIYFLGTPFSLVYNFAASAMRAKGDSSRPLIFLTVSGVMNVALNLLFVIVFRMSVAGVAIATVISQAVSAVLSVASLWKNGGEIKLSLKEMRFDLRSFGEIAKIGLPAGIQGSVFSISNVIIQSTINSYGSVVIAGNSAAQNVEGYLNSTVSSIYQAELAFIGQNYGAKRPDNVKKIIKNAALMMVLSMTLLSTVVILFDDALLAIFNPDPQAISIGKIRIAVNCGFYVLFGFMDFAVGIMRGLGYGLTPMMIAILGVCGTRLLWVFLIYPIAPSLRLLYISYPVSWTIAFLGHMTSFLLVRKKTFSRLLAKSSFDN